jgi:Domain of unknown function (DUF6438)
MAGTDKVSYYECKDFLFPSLIITLFIVVIFLCQGPWRREKNHAISWVYLCVVRKLMKPLITYILITFFVTKVHSQNEGLLGIWYSADQDFIEFTPKYWTIESGKDLWSTGFTIFQRDNNKLRFLSEYYDSRDDNKIKTDFKKSYDFLLKEYTNDFIILEPISKLSKEFFNNRKEIQFFKRNYFIDTSIKFEKLVFRTTECFGTCPTLNIQLDKEENIIYSGHVYNDTALSGNFWGTISKKDMDTLVQLLRNCQLETLHWRTHNCCDGSMITLIVYYNDKRKYFKSMFPPNISEDLISFLYKLNSKATLTRREEKFVFEE